MAVAGEALTNPDLEDELSVSRNRNQLPVSVNPSYVSFGLVGFCMSGSARIVVYNSEHTVCGGELMIILPGQFIACTETSEDFTMNFFSFAQTLFEDTISGIGRFSPQFFFHVRSNFHFQLPEKEVIQFMSLFNLLEIQVDSPRNRFPRESTIHLLRIFFLDLYSSFLDSTESVAVACDDRKQELAHNFFNLLTRYYKENREVSFYSDQLYISPKYLSMVVKEITGRSAKDWITEYIIMEIKSLLRDSQLNIQEIVLRTKFSNQSSLGRFFRQHTDMSPLQYRMEKLRQK